MKYSSFLIFLQLFTIFQIVKSASSELKDCTYDENTSHIEYFCDSALGARFKDSYCNNYTSLILKTNMRIVSFRGCSFSQFNPDLIDFFNNVVTFNATNLGIDSFDKKTFQNTVHLEKFIYFPIITSKVFHLNCSSIRQSSWKLTCRTIKLKNFCQIILTVYSS